MSSKNSTLTKLRENEREIRKDLIIDAAIRLFAAKPFDRVGMRDIASEAGLSPASIYRYFSNRDELFVEALCRESKIIEQEIRRAKDSESEASIEKIASTFVDYLIEHDTFFKMMTYFMITGRIAEDTLEKFNETERKLLDVFDDIFENLGAKGPVRLTSHAFFATLNGILITFHNYPGRSSEDTRKHMHRLVDIVSRAFKDTSAAITR
ncbi:MAG: TetR/AcrR family transcriptional regulator [Desulfomonile tiedjei]|uniref:TetR/AcrR family transcriptional regulator n=1 Tax=Desulfomonile tiedjei TaxID=2358 RepID=A0A9D6V883_9BACT|nr:TetR/AcrR family transcriptional regulator [Desulfomonile tiedjei]